MGVDSLSANRAKEDRAQAIHEARVSSGMGFWRLVWIVALGILVANVVSDVLTFVLSNFGALLPSATR